MGIHYSLMTGWLCFFFNIYVYITPLSAPTLNASVALNVLEPESSIEVVRQRETSVFGVFIDHILTSAGVNTIRLQTFPLCSIFM